MDRGFPHTIMNTKAKPYPPSYLYPLDIAVLTAVYGKQNIRPAARRNLAWRPFALSWEGLADVYAGTAAFNSGQRSGRVNVSIRGRKCEGQYWLTGERQGQWELDCGDGWMTANGTFLMGDKGSRGTGLDNRGRNVRFSIGAEERGNDG